MARKPLDANATRAEWIPSFGMLLRMLESATRTAATRICRYPLSGAVSEVDAVALEEPLEIRLDAMRDGVRIVQSISITMRSPGHDEELAIGFLVGEGILRDATELDEVFACSTTASSASARNVVRVRLHAHATVHWPTLDRHFYATSSCGVCGKSSLDALRVAGVQPIARDGLQIAASTLCALPASLRSEQAVFDQTGGLHAAGVFTREGALVALREDVGRHNALDKVLGARFLLGDFPLSQSVLCLSGRTSFELVQKAAVAGIPVIAAVGAPTSAAVELARAFDLTLIGFLRTDRFNIYHGAWRVEMEA